MLSVWGEAMLMDFVQTLWLALVTTLILSALLLILLT
jgi:hypothetical protein